jgi:hypothetical protein
MLRQLRGCAPPARLDPEVWLPEPDLAR